MGSRVRVPPRSPRKINHLHRNQADCKKALCGHCVGKSVAAPLPSPGRENKGFCRAGFGLGRAAVLPTQTAHTARYPAVTLGSPLVSPGFAGCHGAPGVLATAWLATMAPAGHAKSRPGITPCGLIRDCWFPSSIALVIISGEERKGSGPLRKDSASRSAPAALLAAVMLMAFRAERTHEHFCSTRAQRRINK
jgi:hypothetical protein